MQHFKQFENKVMYALAVLLCLTLASMCLMSHMYARYATGATGSDSARIAIFGHNESINVDSFPSNWKPGTKYAFNITVSDQKNKETSEVSQKYNIEVVTQGNLPLTYTLKDSAGNQIGQFMESSNPKQTFTNSNMKFQAGQSQEHNYELQVEWPENEKDSGFAEIPDTLKINVNVEQID